ncbi:unnamed protein product [Brassica rapa subsp. narinosa]
MFLRGYNHTIVSPQPGGYQKLTLNLIYLMPRSAPKQVRHLPKSLYLIYPLGWLYSHS